MNKYNRYGSFSILSVGLLTLIFILSNNALVLGFNRNYIQTSPFLTTPYYGKKGINSYFDHRYPTYNAPPNSTYSNVIRYDGEDLPSCSWVGQPGTICYDGHNGTDFQMVYEPVLAAAGGTVTAIGWDVPNCHDPIQNPALSCGYGLYVDIDHGNSFKTRYGHLSAIAVSYGNPVQGADYWARWQPTLPVPGFYEVQIYVPTMNSTSWQARYIVSGPVRYQATLVDQFGSSNRWLSLGHYDFYISGYPFGVEIFDETGESSNSYRRLGVDTVRYQLLKPAFLPLVQNNY